MRRVDVLVVGGGPAGLLAAVVCGRAGLATLVVERGRYPIDKACGEGVMPTGIEHLGRLGVLAHLDPAACAPFSGIEYRSAAGRTAVADFAEGPGLGVRRLALSAACLARAREVGVEVREGVVVGELRREADGLVARVGDDEVHARLVVGADGLKSRVARWAGLVRPVGGRRRFGTRRHFVGVPGNGRVEVHWAGGVEAYVTPVGTREVGVALLWSPEVLGEATGPAHFDRLLARFPLLAERFGDAPGGEISSAGPFEHRVSSPVADGVLLVGDAAGYLDAITGEGISLAAAQALALERAVVPVLAADRSSSPPAGALADYARAVRSAQRPYLRMTRTALLLSRHTRWAERAVAGLASSPSAFRHLLSANMGLRRPWAMSPWAAARFVWGWLTAPRPSCG